MDFKITEPDKIIDLDGSQYEKYVVDYLIPNVIVGLNIQSNCKNYSNNNEYDNLMEWISIQTDKIYKHLLEMKEHLNLCYKKLNSMRKIIDNCYQIESDVLNLNEVSIKNQIANRLRLCHLNYLEDNIDKTDCNLQIFNDYCMIVEKALNNDFFTIDNLIIKPSETLQNYINCIHAIIKFLGNTEFDIHNGIIEELTANNMSKKLDFEFYNCIRPWDSILFVRIVSIEGSKIIGSTLDMFKSEELDIIQNNTCVQFEKSHIYMIPQKFNDFLYNFSRHIEKYNEIETIRNTIGLIPVSLHDYVVIRFKKDAKTSDFICQVCDIDEEAGIIYVSVKEQLQYSCKDNSFNQIDDTSSIEDLVNTIQLVTCNDIIEKMI